MVISPSQQLSAAVAAHSLAIAFTERAHHEGNERLAAHWAAQADAERIGIAIAAERA